MLEEFCRAIIGNKILNITRKINHAVRIDYETLSNYSFLFNRHTVHFKLKLLKFTSNKYRPLTVMYRISFERPCRKSITTTYTIFNREHAGVTPINMCEFCSNQRIFTGVIVRTDRQTDKPKSLKLFNFSWKVLKNDRSNFSFPGVYFSSKL